MEYSKNLEMTEIKTIKIYPKKNKEFTAEDLCVISLPYGFVRSVQKIVKNGLAVGLVTFSDAISATLAIKNLKMDRDFIVGLFTKKKLRDINKRRPESPVCRGHIFQQVHSNDMPPLMHHGMDQRQYLLISNVPSLKARVDIFKLLPAGTTIDKTFKYSVRVIVPDLFQAMELKDVLSGLYTGSKRLRVEFDNFRKRDFPPKTGIWDGRKKYPLQA